MKRITRMTEKGAALIMGENYEDQAAAKRDLMVRFRKALDRLYEYEELGLEPEEITDLLKSSEIIRSRLNTMVTWKSPRKDKSYRLELATVRISRDKKTDKLHMQAELLDPQGQSCLIIAAVRDIQELKNAKI